MRKKERREHRGLQGGVHGVIKHCGYARKHQDFVKQVHRREGRPPETRRGSYCRDLTPGNSYVVSIGVYPDHSKERRASVNNSIFVSSSSPQQLTMGGFQNLTR